MQLELKLKLKLIPYMVINLGGSVQTQTYTVLYISSSVLQFVCEFGSKVKTVIYFL